MLTPTVLRLEAGVAFSGQEKRTSITLEKYHRVCSSSLPPPLSRERWKTLPTQTGAKKANKSAGPQKFLEVYVLDGFATAPFFDPDAHGVDLPVAIHQSGRSWVLEEGVSGVIKSLVKDVWRWSEGKELTVVGYDIDSLVAVIKTREQQGRTDKVGGSEQSFDSRSSTPMGAGEYQSLLRAIAEEVAKICLAEKSKYGRASPGIQAFYGVGGAGLGGRCSDGPAGGRPGR